MSIPADVQVTMTASPADHLVPGEPIQAALTITNLGPGTITKLTLVSAPYVDEYHLTALDCHDLLPVVADQNNGFYYLLLWSAVGPIGSQVTELDVGQSLTCNMTLVLTPAAPPNYTFSFGILDGYVDINPANDTGSVVLQQSIPTVPACGRLSLCALAMLVAVLGLCALSPRRARRLGFSRAADKKIARTS